MGGNKQIKWDSEKIELLTKEYPYGDKKELCAKLGISYEALKSAARIFGVKSMKSKNFYKLKALNENSPIIQYWLGFIMADGFISNSGELKICLSIIDLEHLKKIAKIIKSNIVIRKTKTKYGNNEYCFISCKDVVYGVIIKEKLNITDNKTVNAPSLSFIDGKDFFMSFLAGFIDGDGMIGFKGGNPYLLRIMCHANWLDNLIFIKNRLLTYFNMNITVKLTKKNYSYLSISNASDILKLKTEFDKLKLPLMERKWGKINENTIGIHFNSKKIY